MHLKCIYLCDSICCSHVASSLHPVLFWNYSKVSRALILWHGSQTRYHACFTCACARAHARIFGVQWCGLGCIAGRRRLLLLTNSWNQLISPPGAFTICLYSITTSHYERRSKKTWFSHTRWLCAGTNTHTLSPALCHCQWCISWQAVLMAHQLKHRPPVL